MSFIRITGLIAAMGLMASPAFGAPLQDVRLAVDDTIARLAPASFSVSVLAAHDWGRRRPLAGARVSATLVDEDGTTHPLGEGRTSKAGHTTVGFRVPAIEPGPWRLQVKVSSALGEEVVSHTVQVVNRARLHLRTDRVVYRPGETLRWRAAVFGGVDARPRATPVEVSILDPRGTRMWRGRVEADETGMVAGDLPLSPDAPLGKWKLEARADDASAQARIELRPAKRPAFFVDAARTDDGVRITARHATGEPVRGRIRAEIGGRRVTGTLDDGGAFTHVGPESRGPVRAMVIDGAHRQERVSLSADPAASGTVELGIVLENDTLEPDVRQHVTVVATDAAGRFTTRVPTLEAEGADIARIARAGGVARYAITPKGGANIELVARLGGTTTTKRVEVDDRPRIVVRPRSPIAEPGAPIEVVGYAATDGPVEIGLLRGEAAIATTVVEARRGRFRAVLNPPDGLYGVGVVRASEARFDATEGTLVTRSGAAVVYLRPTPLTVGLDVAEVHAPGARTALGVHVTDAAGRPVPGVGLAAEAVDTRALRLGDPGPDLARVLTAMDTDGATVAGAAFVDLLHADDSPAVTLTRAAALSAIPPDVGEPYRTDDAVERWSAEQARLGNLGYAVGQPLMTWPGAIVRWRNGRWQWAMPLDAVLGHMGWKADRRLDPWGRRTGWRYARRFASDLTRASLVVPIAEERLYAIIDALSEDAIDAIHRGEALSKALALPPHLAVDPWGHRVVAVLRGERDIDLIAPGPDGRVGTRDDVQVENVLSPGMVRAGLGARGYGAGSGFARSRGVAYGHGGTGVVKAAAVRRRFDETALWRVGARTDDSGRARLPMHMPDSLTTWRVRVEALSRAGAVGAAEAHIRTWLPFSVQATLPESLTEGDAYTVPLVLSNRTDTAQTMRVLGQVGGALAEAAVDRTIELPAGEVRAVPLPVRAIRPGEGTVRLDLMVDGEAVDAVERTLTIEGRGRLERSVVSTVLSGDRRTLAFTAPPSAAGTHRVELRAFRGAADAALDGLDSLVRAPYGCFEQTSSATFPTLLVLRLLDPADPATAELRKKARDFVATGYQRLVGYEVDGGGFSWFGEAPANQVLTAYGLVEFADMAAVYPVDPNVISRTVKWLAEQQREDGGWDPDAKWLHDWSAVQGAVSTTAYIAWALAEAGEARGAVGDAALEKARGFLRANRAALMDDVYLTTLWALAEDEQRRGEALEVVAGRAKGGHLPAGRTLFGGGVQADVQTTALWASARLRHGQSDAAARAWLWENRAPRGGWGTTQATVMALRATVAGQQPTASGQLEVLVDGQPAGQLDLDAIDVPMVALTAGAGERTVELRGDVPPGLQLDLRQRWRSTRPAIAEQSGMVVSLTPDRASTARGGRIGMTLSLHNPGTEAIAMPTIEVPVPPGFSADRATLEAMRAEDRIARYELLGRRVDLYLTELDPGERIELPYALIADAECRVTQRGAVAYAYYDPQIRGTSAPLTLEATRPQALAINR